MTSGLRFSVDTSPTKEVVVSSLTRDASVEACIFDLIDNSVDAARDTARARIVNQDETTTIDDYSGFTISLTIDGTGLKIVDNCGGKASKNFAQWLCDLGSVQRTRQASVFLASA